MNKYKLIWELYDSTPRTLRMESTMQTSWVTNNAIADSIIMNMTCRSLVPPVEPKVRSTEVIVALTSKNTLRILKTIKPVTRVFTAMDKVILVRDTVFIQTALKIWFCTNIFAPFFASQITRGNKLKLAYQMKIEWLTQVCDCQEWRNDHDTDILTPHDPTTVDLWRYRWIELWVCEKYHGLCVLWCIVRWSHNIQLLWFGQSKVEITLALSQIELEVEAIVY